MRAIDDACYLVMTVCMYDIVKYSTIYFIILQKKLICGQKSGWVIRKGTRPLFCGDFLYIQAFEATRRFLETLKTAGESLDLPLQDPKMRATLIC